MSPTVAEQASPARVAAVALLEALHRQPDEDTPLPVLLARHGGRLHLDTRDMALLTELTCGVLRSEKRLWTLLRPFLRKPDSLSASLHFLLLTAAYELLFLDHIPGRATVHQAVGWTRRRYGPALGGLVNAVLRALDRNLERVRDEDAHFLALDPAQADAEDVERMGSLPPHLAKQWVRDYGPARAWEFARRAACKPAPGCRVNAARPEAEATRHELLRAGGQPLGRYGFVFSQEHADLPTLLGRLEAEGRLSRQGAGSLLAAEHLADVLRNDGGLAEAPLWDACCGRGGKTCILLEHGLSVTLASDPVQSRLSALDAALNRLGLPRPELARTSAQTLAPTLSTRFPIILLDVPCSGTGTLARNPELRLRLTPRRRQEISSLQTELLQTAWPVLASGGLLAYATCALSREENEERIEAFTASMSDAHLVEQNLMDSGLPGQDILFLALIRKR